MTDEARTSEHSDCFRPFDFDTPVPIRISSHLKRAYERIFIFLRAFLGQRQKIFEIWHSVVLHERGE